MQKKLDKKTKPPKVKASPIDEVADEHKSLVVEVVGWFASKGRDDTASTFEKGLQFCRVKEVMPERAFGRWAGVACGYTSRQARHFMAVSNNLPAYRQRFEALGVAATVLFTLASADADKIEEVLAVFESGQRLTVGQIKKLIKPEGTDAKREPADVGGLAALRRTAEAKLKDQLALIETLTKKSLQFVEQCVADLAKGKHLSKVKFADGVELDCRKAYDLLTNAAGPMYSGFNERGNMRPGEIKGDSWTPAQTVLNKLGNAPYWPGRTEFPDWVVNQVLPALRFIVLGEPLPGTAAAAIIEDASSEGAPEEEPIFSGEDEIDAEAGVEAPAVSEKIAALAIGSTFDVTTDDAKVLLANV